MPEMGENKVQQNPFQELAVFGEKKPKKLRGGFMAPNRDANFPVIRFNFLMIVPH